MSDNQDLKRFAELLIQLVRDRAVEVGDQLAEGRFRGPGSERWREYAKNPMVREALVALVPEVVDEVLFEFLNAIDNGELPLAWRCQDASWTSLEKLGQGEMAGWLMMGKGGWLDSFSHQRFSDPLANVELRLPGESDEA